MTKAWNDFLWQRRSFPLTVSNRLSKEQMKTGQCVIEICCYHSYLLIGVPCFRLTHPDWIENDKRKQSRRNRKHHCCPIIAQRRCWGILLQMGFILRSWNLTVHKIPSCKLTTIISTKKHFVSSRVRVWDLAIFVPNFLFFMFMLLRFNRARLKLRATSSPIFATFYSLVSLSVFYQFPQWSFCS